MSPDFAKYAKDKYNYDVSFSFAGAPFGQLFPEGRDLARHQEPGIQHHHQRQSVAGRAGNPKWIVKLNDIIAKDRR